MGIIAFRIATCALAASLLNADAEAQCQPVEAAELAPAGGAAGDLFGYDVALFGDLVLVSSRRDGEHGQQAGAAYLYARDQGGAGNWGEVAKLTAADPKPFQVFGSAVAVGADTAIVGAGCDNQLGSCAGAAYVFERDEGGAGAWGQAQKLLASDGKGGDFFGNTADIEGNLAIVGAPFWAGAPGNDAGAAYVFERGPSGWNETNILTAIDAAPSSSFGYALDLDGDSLCVTAPNDDGAASNAGAAYVCRRNPVTGDWVEEQKLLPSTTYSGLRFGESCGISGDTLVVGVTESVVGFDSGAVYVFERTPATGTWSQTAKLVPQSAQAHDWFGTGVAISGDVIVGGANGRDGPKDSGVAFVFERSPSAPQGWLETHALRAGSPAKDDGLGRNVALAGRTVLVGAPSNILQPVGTGEAVVFDDVAPPPPTTYCTAGTSANGCLPVLSTVGHARLSQPDGFEIGVGDIDGARSAILFWGTAPQAKTWGAASWFCIVPPVRRTPVQTTTGAAGSCDGTFSLDFNDWMATYPQKAPSAGTNVLAQVWYRDPAGQGKTSSMTAGLSFGVCP
jgi:hypothetical protein